MKPHLVAGFLLLGLFFFPKLAGVATCLAQIGSEPSIVEVERDFRELPMESRRLCGPLFWLHGEDSRERLEHFVGKVAEGGNGAFTAESRPHKDWLGEGWYRDLEICLRAAREQGLKLWIFDEKWWPSQSVGGKVPARYAAKQLVASAVEVEGPTMHQEDGYSGDRFIAAVAGRLRADAAVDGASLVDLAPSIREGKLSWQVPAGRWKIMKFTYQVAAGLGQSGGKELSVDGASKDCVDWYLQTVYQPHYDRFKADFGKTIVGFFYDEPETRGDWGTELNLVLAERGVDWKRAYVAYKFRLSPEEQAAGRYQYLEARAEAWGRTMYGGITRWCAEHGVKSIGHFMEHADMYLLEDFCAGDLMRLQKYSSMGGIDAVFSQFKPGQRAAYDAPCWQTPKLGSSVTHAYGKPDDISMVEIFGARGQDLTYPEMKWWADHMHVCGVNFLIPHSFNPRAPKDTDCPPYFYMEQYEPRWPLYRVFADYTSRLSLLMTGGRHVAPVALLYSGNTSHVGKALTPEGISESLQDSLYDCDWIPLEVFEKDATIAGHNLQLRSESYQVLVVPAAEVITHESLLKAREFFLRGGVVIGYGFLPSQSATLGHSMTEITQLVREIWGRAEPSLAVCRTTPTGGRSYFLPAKPTSEELAQVLGGDAGVRPALEVLEGRTDHWLHVLHRVKAGRDVFFIANQNHQGESRTFRFRVAAEGYPEIWDPLRNEICAVPYRRHGKEVELAMEFEPNQSALLVFQQHRRQLPLRTVGGPGNPRRVYALEQVAEPPIEQPRPMLPLGSAEVLEGGSWVWFPEANASKAAAPGTRWFRKQLDLPVGRSISRATFTGTADNALVLYVNGKLVGESDSSAEGWRNPVTLDIRPLLHQGKKLFAIEAVNASAGPNVANPAGLTGALTFEFGQGPALLVRIDSSWRASSEKVSGWNSADLDDSNWQVAKTVAKFGEAAWGHLGGGGITLGPEPAAPYSGRVKVATGDLGKQFVLELTDLSPEEAARVTVNGKDAGGFIGRPLRLDVTRWIKTGQNSIRIEPFGPKSARLCVY